MGPVRKQSIDIGLAVIEAIRPAGARLNIIDIADICECSKTTIQAIEQTALKKLRTRANSQHLRDFVTE